LVLPTRSEGTEHYNEQQLAAPVTRDMMIGVVQPEFRPEAQRPEPKPKTW
jgi:hypothetical protein